MFGVNKVNHNQQLFLRFQDTQASTQARKIASRSYLDNIAEFAEVEEPTPVSVSSPESLGRSLLIRPAVYLSQALQYELVAAQVRVDGHSYTFRLSSLVDVLTEVSYI